MLNTRIKLDLDLEEGDLFIQEDKCSGELYSLHDQNWPAIIDDICGCLHDYLEGLDHGQD